jgi:hypothetical protein
MLPCKIPNISYIYVFFKDLIYIIVYIAWQNYPKSNLIGHFCNHMCPHMCRGKIAGKSPLAVASALNTKLRPLRKAILSS